MAKSPKEKLDDQSIPENSSKLSLISINLVSSKNVQLKVKPIPTNRITFSELFDKEFVPDLKLLTTHLENEGRLDEDCVLEILQIVRGIFRKEDTVMEIAPPIIICGDIHGQFYDLLRLFEIGGPLGEINHFRQYLFLGDYVDRGMFGMECILLLFTMKIAFPDHMFMLRGQIVSSLNGIFLLTNIRKNLSYVPF